MQMGNSKPANSAAKRKTAHTRRLLPRLERRHEPLLARRHFIRRQILFLGFALLMVFVSLGVGVLGYHFSEGLPWLDALLNASMILFGMGPVSELHTNAGKWFASFYALFSGVAFISIVGVTFAPLFHRFLHRFHLSGDDT
jgi:hypothetical protein